MTGRERLASLITKLVLLVILLILFVGAAFAPITQAASRAASCDTAVKICPTGTGPHAITEGDVIQYLIHEPYLGHDTELVRVMSIQAFTYEPLSKTAYFLGTTTGPDALLGTTPALSVTFCGIFSFSATRRTFTGYECANIIFDVQTDEWLEFYSMP